MQAHIRECQIGMGLWISTLFRNRLFENLANHAAWQQAEIASFSDE